jgi:hypothetical protein
VFLKAIAAGVLASTLIFSPLVFGQSAIWSAASPPAVAR